MKKDDNSGVSIKQIMVTTLFLIIAVLGGFKAYGIAYEESVNAIQEIKNASLIDRNFETALVENTEDDFIYVENVSFLAAKVINVSGDTDEHTILEEAERKNTTNYSEKIVSRSNYIREQVSENVTSNTQNKLLTTVLNEIKEFGEKQDEIVENIASGLMTEEISSGDIVNSGDSKEEVDRSEEITETEVEKSSSESLNSSSNVEPINLQPPTEYVRTVDVKATAYCLCKKCCGKSSSNPAYGITASGLKIIPGTNMKVVASDPTVIPLGTKVYIEGLYGARDYGYAIVADTGSAIKNLKIDLYMDTHQMALNWGVKSVRVYILGE